MKTIMASAVALVCCVVASGTVGVSSTMPEVVSMESAGIESGHVELPVIAETSQVDVEVGSESETVTTESRLVWGQDETLESASWTRPPRFSAIEDPAYGTTVERLTNADAGPWDRNDYSRRQAENADGTLFMTHARTYEDVYTFRIYSIDGEPVGDLAIHPDGQPQWHPTEPNIIRYVNGPNASSGSLKLMEINARTNEVQRTIDLTAQIQSRWADAVYIADGEEGSPSADGDHYAWAVYDVQERVLGIVSYDLETGLLDGRDVRHDLGRLDHVSASVTGEFVVAAYVDGTYVYDRTLSEERLLFAGAEHSDLALDANGEDAFVYVDFDTGWVTSVNLETLEQTLMFSIYEGRSNTSVHISGKGYDRPGWVIISTYSCKEDRGEVGEVPDGWACNEVFAAEMVPDGRILNLAHTYTCEGEGRAGEERYYVEAHAVVSRDFEHVYFNSNSNNCNNIAEVYRIDVPNFD